MQWSPHKETVVFAVQSKAVAGLSDTVEAAAQCKGVRKMKEIVQNSQKFKSIHRRTRNQRMEIPEENDKEAAMISEGNGRTGRADKLSGGCTP